MNQCKQCGATLPEDSQYCLQCGSENKPGSTSQPQKELDFLKPSLIGGLALGVLSAIPYILMVNVLCCFWVLGGGGLTTWLLNQQRPGGLKYGDGAFGGVFSGLIGAFVATLISIPVQMLTLTPERVAQVQAQFDQVPQMPPAMREAMLQFLTPGFNLTRTLFGLVFNMILFGLFAMIGGILTVAIVGRKKPD